MKYCFSLFLCTMLLAGCKQAYQPAQYSNDGRLSNPSMGFYGYTIDVPDGYELVDEYSKPPYMDDGVYLYMMQVLENQRGFYNAEVMNQDSFAFYNTNKRTMIVFIARQELNHRKPFSMWSAKEIENDITRFNNARKSNGLYGGEWTLIHDLNGRAGYYFRGKYELGAARAMHVTQLFILGKLNEVLVIEGYTLSADDTLINKDVRTMARSASFEKN